MVVKIYISGISGNKEVKKRQQRVTMILDSKNVEYETIDITEPGREMEKEFMQSHSKARDSKYPLPPQIFNEEDYCGDYEDFDLANEIDDLEKFLKITSEVSTAEITFDSKSQSKEIQENGNTSSREPSTEKDASNMPSESLEERMSENEQSEESKPPEVEEEAKQEEQMEENAEKNEENEENEEKSDNQEKEE